MCVIVSKRNEPLYISKSDHMIWLDSSDWGNLEVILPALFEAYRSDTIVAETKIIGRRLQQADLVDRMMQDVTISYCDLTGADLSHAEAQNACLDYSNLTEADLYETNLTRASLRYTTFFKAVCWKALFGTADLTCANLGRAMLAGQP